MFLLQMCHFQSKVIRRFNLVVRRNCAKLIMSWEVQTLGHSFLDFGDLQFRFWLIWLTIQLIIFKFIKAKKTFRSSCNQALFLSKMPSFIGTFLYAQTDFFDVKTNLLLGCGIFRRPSNGWVFPRPETHLNCFTCAFNFLREGAVIGEIGDLPVLERRFRQELSPIVNRCTQEPVWWLVDWLLSFRGVLSPTQKGVNRDKRGLRRYGLYLIHAHLILWFLIVSFDCEAVSEHYPLSNRWNMDEVRDFYLSAVDVQYYSEAGENHFIRVSNPANSLIVKFQISRIQELIIFVPPLIIESALDRISRWLIWDWCLAFFVAHRSIISHNIGHQFRHDDL